MIASTPIATMADYNLMFKSISPENICSFIAPPITFFIKFALDF